MTAKTKSKKKHKKTAKTVDPVGTSEADLGWQDCQIELRGSSHRSRLIKRLLGNLRGKKTPGAGSPLGWLVSQDVDPEKLKLVNGWHATVMKQLKLKTLANEIAEIILRIETEIKDPGDALIALAASHAIRAIAGKCDYSTWQSIVSHLLKIAEAAESDSQLSPSLYQQLAIELPLTLAFQIPEIEDYQQLAGDRCQDLASTISEMLDHDGWPHARFLAEFGPVVASWARCGVVVSDLELEQGFESASQLEWVVRQVARMLRPDRRFVFSDPASSPASPEFLECLFELSSDPEDKRLLKFLLSNASGKSKPSSLSTIEASNLSEWSESAVLQSRWASNSPKLAVDYSRNKCWVELGRDVGLFHGEAAPEISFNGEFLISDEPFEVACAEHNEEVEYLELEKELGKGVTLTRQFLLSRTEEFLVIADLIVPATAGRIDYRTRWPLAPGVDGMHESETREVYLTAGGIQALVLPLALPEWKTARTDDSLKFDKESPEQPSLNLTQSIDGAGLYAPLFIDLNPKRSKKKRTWRQLTVAEQMRSVARDEACAFRVQLDKHQWIFYRTVSSFGNRTFMGENINCEFSFNRFGKKGAVDTLIEI